MTNKQKRCFKQTLTRFKLKLVFKVTEKIKPIFNKSCVCKTCLSYELNPTLEKIDWIKAS